MVDSTGCEGGVGAGGLDGSEDVVVRTSRIEKQVVSGVLVILRMFTSTGLGHYPVRSRSSSSRVLRHLN